MAADSAAAPQPDGPEHERFSLLEVARFRKDDGRSLILYSHDEDGAQGGEASGGEPARDGERT